MMKLKIEAFSVSMIFHYFHGRHLLLVSESVLYIAQYNQKKVKNSFPYYV